MIPVTLPPGRLRLTTRPAWTGSVAITKTIRNRCRRGLGSDSRRRLGGFQIDGKFEIRGLFDGEIARLRSPQNFGDVGGGAPPHGASVHAIRHESARIDVVSKDEHCWQAVPDRKFRNVRALRRERRTRQHVHHLRFALHDRSKSCIEIIWWIFKLERA